MADVRIRYLVDLVDRGTQKMLSQDRVVQRSMATTDKLNAKLARTAQQAGTAQTQAATRAATGATQLTGAVRHLSQAQGQALQTGGRAAASMTANANATTRASAAYRGLGSAEQHAARVGAQVQQVSEATARAKRAEAAAVNQATAAHRSNRGTPRPATPRNAPPAAGGVAAGAAATGRLAVGLGAIFSAKAVIDFDKALRNVNSIAQLSERELQRVGQRVRELGGQTAQAPITLANGLYDLVSSGFNAKESMQILGSTARAATAGLTTTEVSTKAVAAVLNAYRMPASAAGKVSDQLFRTVDRGVISFESLAQEVGDVLPFASSLGVGLKQVGASIATMTKAGISAPETMTRIKAIMTTLLKPGTALSETLKKLGYESGEALIKQKGFQGALETLAKTTGGSKEELAKLFPNVRALGGALALTGKNSKGAKEDLEGMGKASGATSRALAQQSQSTAYQWQQVKANAQSLAITVGQNLLPPLNKILKTFVGLPGPVKLGIAAFAGFGLVIGPVMRLGRDIRALGGAIKTVGGVARGSRIGQALASGVKGASGRVGKALGGVRDVVARVMGRAGRSGGTAVAGSVAGNAADALPGRMGRLRDKFRRAFTSVFRSAGNSAGSVATTRIASTVSTDVGPGLNHGKRLGRMKGAFGGVGRTLGKTMGLAAVAAMTFEIYRASPELQQAFPVQVADPKKGKGMRIPILGPMLNSLLPGKRVGGRIAAMATGGLVPFMAAGGEMIVHRGRGAVVPGNPRRDGTLMAAPAGAAVLTGHGQQLMAGGATLSSALARQAPHFQAGGRVPATVTAPAPPVAMPSPADAQVVGADAGGQFVAGAAAGTVEAGAQWKVAAVEVGRQVGVATAAAGAAAYAPQFIRAAQQQLTQRAGQLVIPPDLLKAPSLEPAIGGVTAKLEQGKAMVRDFGQAAQQSLSRAETSVKGFVAASRGLSRTDAPRGLDRLADGATDVGRRFPGARGELRRFASGADNAGDQARVAGGRITRALGNAASTGGDHLERLRNTTTSSMGSVRRRMDNDSTAGRKALAGNMSSAAGAIQSSMSLGREATSRGLANIRRQMTNALKLYGVGERARGGPVRKATGGLVQVGREGEAGRDTVPAMLNGQPHVIARGENVAVFTRHQKRAADQMMAPIGGLSGLFSKVATPNYMARGGMVRVPGDPNTTGGRDKVNPAIARSVSSWIRRFKIQIGYGYDPGGGHQSPGHNVTGTALDVVPGPGGSWATLEAGLRAAIRAGKKVLYGTGGIGISYPNHGRGNHAHVEWGGGGGVPGGGIARIKRPNVRDDLGQVSQIAQGAVDKVRRAAQRKLDRAMEDLAVTSHGPGPGGGIGEAAARRVIAQAMRVVGIPQGLRSGWMGMAVRQARRESGFNPSAQNNWDVNARRGTPSIGMFQTIGPTFRAHMLRGMGNIRNPLHNAVAAFRYMRQTYGGGNWARALNVMQARGGGAYARGGFVPPFVGSYQTGGTIPQDGLAYVHQGEQVVPARAARGGFVDPMARVRQLNQLPHNADTRTKRALTALEEALAQTRRVTVAEIERTRKELEGMIARVRRGGVTRRERPQVQRLERALTLVGREATERVLTTGGPTAQVRALGALPANAETRADRHLQALEEALQHARRVTFTVLDRTRSELEKMIRRIRRHGVATRERPQLERLERALEMVQTQTTERLQGIGAGVGGAIESAQRIGGRVERHLGLRGIEADSVEGLQWTAWGLTQQRDAMTGQIAPLQAAIRRAKAARNTDASRDLEEQLRGLQDSIADTAVQLAQNARAQVFTHAQDRVDLVGFHAGLGRHAQAGIEAGQRLARTTDTPGGMLERAGAIQAHVIPHLRQQIDALNAQAWHALTVGSIDVWRQAVDAAAGAAVELTGAMADSADLVRDAAFRVRQDAVDLTAHGYSRVDSLLSRLELEQRLAGTFETGGGARADFISAQVLPALRSEVAALQAQQAEAVGQGDPVLARQIAEQVWAKENAVLQAQLEAQEAIRDSAEDLKEYGGTLALQSRGQQFTDLRNTIVGVASRPRGCRYRSSPRCG